MNDNDAAFKLQLEKLKDGGELELEYCGMIMRVSAVHGMFMVLTETYVSYDRFNDFIRTKQYFMKDNEQYLIHKNKIYHCSFLINADFNSAINAAYAAVKDSIAYR